MTHLSDTMSPHVANVSFLVAPLDPARSVDRRWNQHQTVDSLRVFQGVSQKDVTSHSNTDTDVFYDSQVVQNLGNLEKDVAICTLGRAFI